METEVIRTIAGMNAGALGIWLFGLILVSGQVLKWVGEWRAWRQLSPEARQANREGFQAQADLLQRQLDAERSENRRGRAEIAALRDRLNNRDIDFDKYRAACQAETDQLRDEVRHLDDLVVGFRRKLDEASFKRFEDLTTAEAPLAVAAGERAKQIVQRRGGGGDNAK